jgi:predicted metal-dependent hydrolase
MSQPASPLQMVLDLFSTERADAATPEAPPLSPSAIKKEAASADGAGATADSNLFCAPWHHPRSNRLARLQGANVGYELQRVRRRSIGLVVAADGLCVRAPRWVSQQQIDDVLLNKAAWVLKKLAQAHDQARRDPVPALEWRDGALLPVRGQPVRLQLGVAGATTAGRWAPHLPTAAAAAQAPIRASETAPSPRVLQLPLALDAPAEQVRDAVQAWLMRQARAWFSLRLEHFAPQLGVRYSRLRLSSARTRWGSASADGTIRLNWRLIHLSDAVIDYVVVHELSHLRVMNHSPQFWNTVGEVLPQWKALRAELKQVKLPAA